MNVGHVRAAEQIAGPEPRAASFASSVIRRSCSVVPWPQVGARLCARLLLGDLGHPYEADHQHLTVLVVDSKKKEPNRYSVVIFTAPQGEGGRYQRYWFYRDCNTPNADLHGVSGYLFVDGCSVRWKKSGHAYVCR